MGNFSVAFTQILESINKLKKYSFLLWRVYHTKYASLAIFISATNLKNVKIWKIISILIYLYIILLLLLLFLLFFEVLYYDCNFSFPFLLPNRPINLPSLPFKFREPLLSSNFVMSTSLYFYVYVSSYVFLNITCSIHRMLHVCMYVYRAEHFCSRKPISVLLPFVGHLFCFKHCSFA